MKFNLPTGHTDMASALASSGPVQQMKTVMANNAACQIIVGGNNNDVCTSHGGMTVDITAVTTDTSATPVTAKYTVGGKWASSTDCEMTANVTSHLPMSTRAGL